jgi:hypothetical protein
LTCVLDSVTQGTCSSPESLSSSATALTSSRSSPTADCPLR